MIRRKSFFCLFVLIAFLAAFSLPAQEQAAKLTDDEKDPGDISFYFQPSSARICPLANPNNSYREGFVVTHVGDAVVNDIFAGTDRKHGEVIQKIAKTLTPQSFAAGKLFTLKNLTEHHPEGVGYNVIGLLEGSDPKLKDDVIIVGGHLGRLRRCYEIMPGANDNNSAVAVTLGVPDALARCAVKSRRSILFILFGGEEQAVHGSGYYLEHPVVPLEKTMGFINMDGVGCGDRLNALAAKNYPAFWDFVDRANKKYGHDSTPPVLCGRVFRRSPSAPPARRLIITSPRTTSIPSPRRSWKIWPGSFSFPCLTWPTRRRSTSGKVSREL